MGDELVVLMNGTTAGSVTNEKGKLRFEYDDNYRQLSNAIPLSVSMPIQVKSHGDSVISPWLWGLLPDNPDVLNRWAREYQVNVSSPFSLLSTPIGEDCAGAVQFLTPERFTIFDPNQGEVEWLSESEVAHRLTDIRQDATAWLGNTFTGQFSLAGAQAKTALLKSEDRWGVPHGAIPTNVILKPAIAGFDQHDLNEHICLTAANRLGLESAKSTIETFDNETALVVERFDRVQHDDRLIRIHQEDLCQALSVPPSGKYQNEGGPGVKDIVKLFERVLSPRTAKASTWKLIDAIIFNWLICGTDAHAKNYAFLLTGEGTTLAPLYDIGSALPYDVETPKLQMAMKLGGEYRIKTIRRQNWEKFAEELGLDRTEVLERCAIMTQHIVDAFDDVVQSSEVRVLKSKLPNLLLEQLVIRANECQQTL